MKSTYELLSIYLDRQPLPKKIPEIICEYQMPLCSEIEDEYNLYDLPVCFRKISGLKLLSFQSISIALSLINKLVNCKKIYVPWTIIHAQLSQIDYFSNVFCSRFF